MYITQSSIGQGVRYQKYTNHITFMHRYRFKIMVNIMI